MNIEKATSELHRCFSLFNQHFFNNELKEPAITIQSKGKRNAYGWCSRIEFWQGQESRHEINISAEYLDRPYLDILQTLLHEMVHLDNGAKGIQDVSRSGQYHNKRFKETCELKGLTYPHDKPDKKIGYSAVVLKPETKELIESSFNVTQESFSIARVVPEQVKANSPKSYKLECPSCGLKVRATKQGLSVNCNECKQELIEY
jgi:hypothetical protein